MKKSIFTLFVAIILIGMYSCSESEQELTDLGNQVLITRALPDTVPSYIPYIPNPDSVKKRNTRANYDSNLSDILYTIREMPITIEPRAYSGAQLTMNGVSQPITVHAKYIGNYRQQFYIKILPSVSGIPYLIYGTPAMNQPLAVGQRSDNPDNKILFMSPDGTGSLYGASWDIYRATKNQGYLVIESQSLIGQGDSGNWMDVFNYVWETKGLSSTPVGYGKYQQKETQEFIITPCDTFTLREIKYINQYSAKATFKGNYDIVSSYTNEAYSDDLTIMAFESTVRERSQYIEDKCVNFLLHGLNRKFKRPSVINGEVNLLPSQNTDATVTYSPSYTVVNPLSISLPITVPARTKYEVTYHLKIYDVEVEYEAKIDYTNPKNEEDYRETNLRGIWKGTLYVDEKIEPSIHEIKLDTKEVRIFHPNIKNVSKTNPLKL
ncbi:putative uncharacterized protein [Bacteroides intestinalis CAG:315]|mgnify:CR=1 FL=1|jgi:hypothetical protein|uniref:Uncharacterized protein n=1 Tax=Bacteroides intestinalis TaxID=329854 RepID=A0A412YM55_9BACE|nr:hypothetical protein [Bacteroides intestinalis]RGV58434.1 hypothetical protein DWW10_02070 [Bacteroides intestinalis]RHA63526.1 hypothetical protein DW932_02140 [Bacteroides intestinalis]CDD92231.1 putative uncharacterized protein [Bacteroides intestinalis CAG:315]